MDNYAFCVRSHVFKSGAFASICPVPAEQILVPAFIMNFPGATPLDYKVLHKLPPPPPSGTVKVVRRPMGPSPGTYRKHKIVLGNHGFLMFERYCHNYRSVFDQLCDLMRLLMHAGVFLGGGGGAVFHAFHSL